MRHETVGEEPVKPLKNSSRTAPDPLANRSKPGGHPGHDQSRRLSIPPVAAPEIFERLLWQAFLHAIQSRVRSTFMSAMPRSLRWPSDPASSSTAASFCEAGRRCQGRCIAHEVRADSRADTLRKKRGLFFKIFSARGASIVETGLKWCAVCRGPLKQCSERPLESPRAAFSPRRKLFRRLRRGPWIMAAASESRDGRTAAR